MKPEIVRMSDRLYKWLESAESFSQINKNGSFVVLVLPKRIKSEKTADSYLNEFNQWVCDNINNEHELRGLND